MAQTNRRPAADRAVLAITSVLGLGSLPLAPGTWGTLAALPLWYGLSALPPWPFVGACAAVTALAIAVSDRAEKIYGGHDVQHIVIDEVAGMLCTVVAVPWRWPQVVVALALFRLLDAAKPWPIRWFDQHVPGGLGVVIDDVVAGGIGCAMLHGAAWLHGGWW